MSKPYAWSLLLLMSVAVVAVAVFVGVRRRRARAADAAATAGASLPMCLEPTYVGIVEDVLGDLADLRTQHRAWVEERGRMQDPVELLCILFDDCGVNEWVHAAHASPCPRLHAALREAERLLQPIDLDVEPARLLTNPQWQAFAAQCAEALAALRECRAARGIRRPPAESL